MRELSIDIETYCEVDIKTAGAYKYAEKSEIILFGYSFDYEQPKCIDLLSGEKIPQDVLDALTDPQVRKTAHNAPFELENIGKHLKLELDADQWRCSAVLSAIAGYPMSLDEASKALGTSEKKDSEGKALIRFFCMPCKPSKTNGGRTRNLPEHAPEKWEKFIEYCKQDVSTEQAICKKLDWIALPEEEHKLWVLDQKINRRGWKVDLELARAAIDLDAIFRKRLTIEATQLTGLSNPNSVAQLKDWLTSKGLTIPKTTSVSTGEESESLAKGVIDEMLEHISSGELDLLVDDIDIVERVLQIRQEMSKTSIKKYTAMINAAGEGDRVRGLFQFVGAGRTWRWCLAENTKVMVKNSLGEYEKNIQDVLESDLVFDGDNWVEHEGVVFSGDKKVIEHDGICGSENHLVYIDSTTKIPLLEAKQKNICLWKGSAPISCYTGYTMLRPIMKTYDIINAGPNNRFMANGRIVSNSGRLVQVQNLKRIMTEDELLMLARELVKQRDIENLEWLFGSLSEILSQLIRTSFIAEKGSRLIISDFSAIEARVLAWVAGEEWVLEVFRTHGKIYEATAAKMMHKPIEEVTKEDRQKGKIGALLLGYGGGPQALVNMGADKMGLTAKEQPKLVKDWREANANIVNFWHACEVAAKNSILTGERFKVGAKGISFSMKNGSLLLTLPSRRSLVFPKASIEKYMRSVPIYETIVDEFGEEETIQTGTKMKELEQITFFAVDQYTRKWGKSSTYGGKLAENICQAIARDCLANALLNLDEIGIAICSHVHDEVIAEMPNHITSLEEVNRMMLKQAPWMAGLPLGAAGDESLYYNK